MSALPYVRQYDKAKNVIEGDPFQTECYAWGYPETSVTWHRGALRVVAEANRVMFKNGSVENSTLRIEGANFEDSDDYMCVATNALGSANATITVRVKGKVTVTLRLWRLRGQPFICIVVLFSVY